MSEQGASPRELEAENEALRARMAYLLEQAERNHDIMCRHQAFDLEIVARCRRFPTSTSSPCAWSTPTPTSMA
jgi:hypothetical protein